MSAERATYSAVAFGGGRRASGTRALLVAAIVALLAGLLPVSSAQPVVAADPPDPISGYMGQVDQTNLETLIGKLVTEWGPRNANVFQPTEGDACEASTAFGPYEDSTLDLASDYMHTYFEGLGYPVTEEVINGTGGNAGNWGSIQGEWTGRNVIATKIGTGSPTSSSRLARTSTASHGRPAPATTRPASASWPSWPAS